MKIGILEAGTPPPALVPEHGTYDTMTRRLIGSGHTYDTYRVCDGRFPARVDECEAYVVTGSRAGVYDGAPWIEALTAFLRAARGRTHLVGICFGHQVMARAFGGDVRRAPQGWGIGLHSYDIGARAAWMDAADTIQIAASHQDQVVTQPPRTRVLGASAFTPLAILAYEDHPAVSFQFHPEFTPAFSRALLETRRAPDLAEQEVARAIASLEGANDNERLGGWINRFLSTAGIG